MLSKFDQKTIFKYAIESYFKPRFEVKNLKETHEFLKKKLAVEALTIDTVSKRLTVLFLFYKEKIQH